MVLGLLVAVIQQLEQCIFCRLPLSQSDAFCDQGSDPTHRGMTVGPKHQELTQDRMTLSLIKLVIITENQSLPIMMILMHTRSHCLRQDIIQGKGQYHHQEDLCMNTGLLHFLIISLKVNHVCKL